MSGQKEFLQFMGIAGGTLLGLFALQYWFATYIDVSYHEEIKKRGGFEVVEKARAEEQAALVGLPSAMAKLGKSRNADPRITPRPSEDLSAMSGWVQHPDYETYEPEGAVAPAAPVPAIVPVPRNVPAPAPAPAAAPPATITNQERAQ